jgi:hypothetical protein
MADILSVAALWTPRTVSDRSKSDVGQVNEILCKVIAHNLCVLITCIHEIGLECPTFSLAC